MRRNSVNSAGCLKSAVTVVFSDRDLVLGDTILVIW